MDPRSESEAASGSPQGFSRSTLGIALTVEILAQFDPFSGKASKRI